MSRHVICHDYHGIPGYHKPVCFLQDHIRIYTTLYSEYCGIHNAILRDCACWIHDAGCHKSPNPFNLFFMTCAMSTN